MQITSPSFSNGEPIPAKFTCQGEDISSALDFANIPTDAKSLALIVDDPDAPNGDWVHWLVWNIPPNNLNLPESIDSSFAIQGITSFGENGYGGPCPPSGTHRYFFKLYALDTMLDLSANSKKINLLKAMENHILDYAVLVGTYKKN